LWSLPHPEPLDGLYLPFVAVYPAVPTITAGRANAPLGVIGTPSTASAPDMDNLVLLAH